jgi:hypothetical protein
LKDKGLWIAGYLLVATELQLSSNLRPEADPDTGWAAETRGVASTGPVMVFSSYVPPA